MRRILALTTLFLGFPGLAVAMPFWGAQQSSPPLTPPQTLKSGELGTVRIPTGWHPGPRIHLLQDTYDYGPTLF